MQSLVTRRGRSVSLRACSSWPLGNKWQFEAITLYVLLSPLYLVLIIMLVSFLFLSSSALSSDRQLAMFLTLSSSCWSTCLWLATVLRSLSAISLRASLRIRSDCWRDWSELQQGGPGLFSIVILSIKFKPVVVINIGVGPLRWRELAVSSRICLWCPVNGAWPRRWFRVALTCGQSIIFTRMKLLKVNCQCSFCSVEPQVTAPVFLQRRRNFGISFLQSPLDKLTDNC